MFAVNISPLGGEIDEAGRDAVLPDRDLTQHEGLRGRRLKARYDFAHGGGEAVDLVQEQEVGESDVFELLQNHLQRRHALGIGLADHDSGIAGGKRECAFVEKLHGTGAIDEGEGFVEKFDVRYVELDAHAVIAGFRRRVSDRALGCNRSGSGDCPGAGEDRFEERRLSACEGSDQRDAARAADPISTALSAVSAPRAIRVTHLVPPREARANVRAAPRASVERGKIMVPEALTLRNTNPCPETRTVS